MTLDVCLLSAETLQTPQKAASGEQATNGLAGEASTSTSGTLYAELPQSKGWLCL